APIEGAVVALAEHPFVHYPDRMVQRPMSQSTDEHGFARFSSVGGAVFHLRVTKAGYFAIAKGLRARYDDPYVTVVVMEAGEQVTIRALSDRDEQPVPNVGVYVNFDKPLDGRYLPPIGLHFTDHAGEVHFSRPAGTGGSCFVPSDYRWGGFMALPPQQELVILRLDSGVAARCRIRMEGSNDWIMAPCTLHTKTTFRGEIRAEAVLPDQEGFYIAENQGHPYAPEFRFELLGVGFTDWKKVSHRGTLAHPVELVLKPYAQVTFEVYSVVGNAPVPGARVEARELMANSEAFLETPHSKRVASTLSNELGQGVLRLHSEGLYESPRLGEVEALGMLRLHGKGRYEVFVDGGPSLGRAWRTIDMTAAPTSDLGRILVDGRGSLDLAVVHSGRPAAFYHGWIASDTLGEPGGSSERYRFKTDALGRTLVQGLAPRTYRILVSGPSVLPPTMIPVAWKLVPNSNPFLVSVASSGPTSYTVVIP
ncbi:MAG TPA: hypothetical protein PKA37_15065, partial [Planctomycetota bacterium]|nr:hypothetical protein [Planctomycetota bacterium]